MLLTDQEHRIELRPLRYQFPVVVGDRYDDNWLVVEGEVTTPEASWSFTDSCLLTGEARQISPWLRAAGGETLTGTLPDLAFLEPVLSFSHAAGGHGAGAVRVHLCYEASPVWREGDKGEDEYVIEIRTSTEELRRAADEWDRRLAPFPSR
ncbi:WapI family immunity protein [Streptomyces sp. NPDC002540]